MARAQDLSLNARVCGVFKVGTQRCYMSYVIARVSLFFFFYFLLKTRVKFSFLFALHVILVWV